MIPSSLFTEDLACYFTEKVEIPTALAIDLPAHWIQSPPPSCYKERGVHAVVKGPNPQHWNSSPPLLKVIAPALAPLSSVSSLSLSTGTYLSAYKHVVTVLIVKIKVASDTTIFSSTAAGVSGPTPESHCWLLSHTHTPHLTNQQVLMIPPLKSN